ncbi:MAG: MerR family transcriptional regulator [Synergistaceae bacterium]|jgi:DNA-binding transcriptional MerR regulator|nr:MerR family transcriptional regulator [Synergistaceae bacterium]
MTIDEASERYNIPIKILREYESWGLCGTVKKIMGAWQYDDRDLERLSMIMTLHDIGFENDEVEAYMRLLLEGGSTEAERMRMLNKRRVSALDEIHFKQRQLDRLDYLRHEIRKATQTL